MRLYELTAEHARLLELLETSDEAGASAAIELALGDVQTALEVKATGIAHVLAELRADERQLAAELERLQNKLKRVQTNRERLHAYVHMQLVTRGILRLKADTFEFAIADNPPAVHVVDEALVPDAYKATKTTVSTSVDKRAILRAYDGGRGEVVPGVKVERATRLVIK